MFKLKTKHTEHKIVKEQLNLVETPHYTYVLTDDKTLVEDEKVNIVFNFKDIPKVNALLDLLVQGEAIYLIGYNQFGQKRVESSQIIYFTKESDNVYAVLQQTKLIVKLKLFEIEEKLQSKQFIRVSKYCLVNLGKINYIRPLLNSKLELLMINGDICEVNRRYLKSFKQALKL